MGLDAFVRCRCLEEGKLRQPPEPFTLDDIYIDEDGYLASRMLDDAHRRLESSEYWERYEQLDRLFTKWSDHPCEHDGGKYCSEWVSNIAGKVQFRELVDELGGEGRYPILSHLLPSANGGSFPASQAQAALDELDDFIHRVVSIEMWGLMRAGDDEPIWTGTDSSVFSWMMSPQGEIGMAKGKIYFALSGDTPILTRHFTQTPCGKPYSNGSQPTTITCLDQDATFEIWDSIGEGTPNKTCEFSVVPCKAPFLYEGRYGTAERIRNLLAASLETGNPIRWC